MKKIIIIFMLIALNAGMYAQIKNTETTKVTIETIEAVETLSDDEDHHCISGGPNSTSCSLSGSFEVFSGTCSVTCGGGSYACCSITGCHSL